MPELLPNTRLSHYRIVSKIGEGGMGEVYLAEDTQLERKVAIKFLSEEFSRDEERLRRFVQEAKTVSALNHPNILTIYEIGEAEGKRFIASEFINGETLREKIAGQSLDLHHILEIAIQIASALQAAHASSIVHRDIKPDNVMLREDGLVKVLDFGLAKLTEQQTSGTEEPTRPHVKTRAGTILGTPSYMSPEQTRGKSVDARSDIWSLGVVLYEMLTKRRPFEGETDGDIIATILRTEPVPPSRINAFVPPELDRIIKKTLKKKSDERYQTANDLLIDLKGLKHDLEFERRVGSGEYATQRLAADGSGRKSLLSNKGLVLAGFLALITFAAVIIYWNASRKAEIPDNPIQTAKVFWLMSEAEQLAFIRERSRHIQTLIGDDPADLDDEMLRVIKVEIDDYVRNKDSLSQQPFEEGMRTIYGRATQYATLIISAYKNNSVPPTLGLYQAMIESEYRDCPASHSEHGPVGMFQFSRRTAAKYGLREADYCDVTKQADAAARHMSDLTSDFGEGGANATLGLLSYMEGADQVRDNLRQLRSRGISERSFWAIFRHRNEMVPPLMSRPPPVPLLGRGLNYVPRFFAAAIIGETPQVFELSTQPLSILSEKPL